MKCCDFWENYLKATKEDDWIECESYRNWLHEFCSPYKEKRFDCGRKLLRQKNGMMQKRM
jgi:hypothetical protein